VKTHYEHTWYGRAGDGFRPMELPTVEHLNLVVHYLSRVQWREKLKDVSIPLYE
jgi:hypothetical protein